MRILVATACGDKKNDQPMLAYKLYNSARIKAVYNRRSGCDMSILSGEHGLVDVHEIIAPYECIMDEQRAQELIPFVAEKLKNYDCIIFFRGGAKKSYLSCVTGACKKAEKNLVILGYANMGDINKLPKLIKSLK